MRRSATALCFISALTGALFAIWIKDGANFFGTATAQSPTTQPAPYTSTAPTGQLAPLPVAPPRPTSYLTAEEQTHVNVYEKANRCAVHINTKSIQTDSFFMREYVSPGEGSGIVLDQRGHILTNFHVIEDSAQINVTLHTGSTYQAVPVGADPTTDLAVVKIDAPAGELFPAILGDSTELRVGQRVYAIGNPFGLERTLATGIISSLNRSLTAENRRKLKSLIQIDADINPGNSGGPLLDTSGQMIGLNTAIASKGGDSAGVGFAIPSSTIRRVVPHLIAHGRLVRGDIGISKVYNTGKGLLIAALVEGGPAERAGLRGPKIVVREQRRGGYVYQYRTLDRKAADLIIGADRKKIESAEDLLEIVESKKPGEKVILRIFREGKLQDVAVTLGSDE